MYSRADTHTQIQTQRNMQLHHLYLDVHTQAPAHACARMRTSTIKKKHIYFARYNGFTFDKKEIYGNSKYNTIQYYNITEQSNNAGLEQCIDFPSAVHIWRAGKGVTPLLFSIRAILMHFFRGVVT